MDRLARVTGEVKEVMELAEERKVETSQERTILTEYLEKELQSATSVAGLMFQLLHSDMQQVRNEVSKVADRVDQAYKDLVNRDDQIRYEVSKVADGLDHAYKDLINRDDQIRYEISKKYYTLEEKIDKAHQNLDEKIENVHQTLDKKIDGLYKIMITALITAGITLAAQIIDMIIR